MAGSVSPLMTSIGRDPRRGCARTDAIRSKPSICPKCRSVTSAQIFRAGQALQGLFRRADRADRKLGHFRQRHFQRIAADVVIFHDKDGACITRHGQEAVSHSMHGQEMLGATGVALQFLPQPHHVRIHGARVGKRFVTPHGIQNHIARERAVGILQEVGEQVVLGAA